MADSVTTEQRSHNMAKIRSKNMKPEMEVRRLIHSMGYRFRLHRRDLPGKPDLVFPSRKKVIFVHGCFWHQHNDPDCTVTHTPVSNQGYWLPKLRRNVERDSEHRSRLRELGWDSLTLWECQLGDRERLNRQIVSFLS